MTYHIVPPQGCSGDERRLADDLSKSVSPGREPVKVTEGSEPADLWDALGGKTEYASGEMSSIAHVHIYFIPYFCMDLHVM